MTSTPERRRHPRFTAWLPLRLKVVGGIVQPDPAPLLTQNLSLTGLCFPAPQRIEPGQSIEVEVTLQGAGPDGNNLYISGTGYIVRAESAKKSGWYRLAAIFDESPSGDELEWQKLVAAVDKKRRQH
jgi:PilZ domain-containing protein